MIVYLFHIRHAYWVTQCQKSEWHRKTSACPIDRGNAGTGL